MRLATMIGFATAPPEVRRAGSEALGGRSRNGRVQNLAVHRGAPSPSLGASGGPRLPQLDFLRNDATRSSAR